MMHATALTFARAIQRRTCLPRVITCLLLLASVGAVAKSQVALRGTILDSSTQLGLPGAVVSATDSAGRLMARTMTNAQGAFVLRAARPPAYLDVIRIGYEPQRTSFTRDRIVRIAMTPIPQLLTRVHVSDRAVCPGSSGGEPVLQLWEQARAGLLPSIVAREANPANVHSILYQRELTAEDDVIRRQSERMRVGQATRPFLAMDAKRLAQEGYMRVERSNRQYFAPDADVLFDEAFAASHCFRALHADSAHAGQIGLAFDPQNGRAAPVDVSGVIWMQAHQPEVRSIDFRYTGLEPGMESAGGHLDLVTPPNGATFIDEWFIRIPIIAPVSTGSARFNEGGVVRSRSSEYRSSGVYIAGGVISAARWSDSSAWEVPPTGITGVVIDHGSGEAVANAVITFEGTTDTLVTDSLGRFGNQQMLPGTYRMVTSDTTLVALGRDRSDRRTVVVRKARVIEQRIELPAIQESIAQLCDKPRSASNPAMLAGRIVFSSPASARSARVHVSWRLTDSRLGTLRLSELTREAEVDSRGRFVVCALPLDQRLDLHLSYDGGQADTSIVIHGTYVGSLDWRLRASADRGWHASVEFRPHVHMVHAPPGSFQYWNEARGARQCHRPAFRHRRESLRHAPATSLGHECADITRSWLQRVHRPTRGSSDLVGRAEPLAARLGLRLLPRPETEERPRPQLARQPAQFLDLLGGEEPPGHGSEVGLVAHMFDVDPDLSIGGDPDHREIRRVREIELEPSGEFSAQRRLAVLVLDEAQLTGMRSEVHAEDLAQSAVGGNEPLLQLRRSHPSAPDPLII